MEDIQIIEMYWNRSESAITETSEKYGRYLESISMNILHNSEDVQECVNDTYMNAWNAIPPNRPNSFRAWLAKITRNISFDRYKKSSAQRRGGGETDILISELEDCIPNTNNPQNKIEDQQFAILYWSF